MAKPLALLIDRIKTPIGELGIVADEDGKLRAVEWTEHDSRCAISSGGHERSQLKEISSVQWEFHDLFVFDDDSED